MRSAWKWLGRHRDSIDRAVLIAGLPVLIYAAFTANTANDRAVTANKALVQQATQAAAEAGRTHNALCAVRRDLVERVQGTVEFLKTHPGGFAGVSRQQIEVNLANQRLTIHALRGLRCSP